jgi:hypothetical protein
LKLNDINIIGQIADLKDTEYKNTLALTTLIEIFIEKGLFTREDFSQQAQVLEKLTVAEITSQRRLQLLEHISKNTLL